MRELDPYAATLCPEAKHIPTIGDKHALFSKLYGEDIHNPVTEEDYQKYMSYTGNLTDIAKKANPDFWEEELQHMIDTLFPNKYKMVN